MQCPKCQFENPENMQFCGRCGSKLQNICPECEFANPPEFQFCGKCGARLTQEAPPSVVPKLEDMRDRLYIPEPLRLRMDTAEQEIEGENRLVTALFADISGFTPMSQQLTPEVVVEKVNQCFQAVTDAVYRYEGSINRFIGDCVLAFFGAPLAHENAPERAILSALDMREATLKLGLEISIGINTGMMYFGPIGTQQHLEISAYGADINLAKRLQETAQPGQVLVGEGTYRFTRRAFEFEPLPSLRLKGIVEPVSAYAAIKFLPKPEKIRGIEGLRAELIGRDEEFVQLKDALNEVLRGRGQIVSLIGEAGVGKSRLVSELKAYLERQEEGKEERKEVKEGREERKDGGMEEQKSEFLWLEGRCLSLGMTVNYWPFIDIFEFFGWGSYEDDRTRGEAIVACLRELVTQGALSEDRLEEIGPLLGHLLSVKFGNDWDERLKRASPEQIKHQTFMALRDFFLALCKRQPVILAFEDLHWADSLSLDLISLLMETLTLAPLLLLCIYRPERKHKCWHPSTIASQKCLERYTEIHLRELTPQQSRRLVESLLQIENFPISVKELILSKSQGNPYFVEEVVRSLIDSGIVYRDSDVWKAKEEIESITVPESIQSVILSRIDRLESKLKHVLRNASVIGRLFRRRLLGRVTQEEAELERALWELEDHALIYQERSVPEEEYSFKHVLTQETVYQNILERRRAAFHQQVAEAIEVLYQDGLDEYYEQVAYHYSRSDNKGKAIEYIVKAGQKAAHQYANQEALDYFQSALELAKEGENYNRILGYRAKLLLDLSRGKEAANDYERLLKSARQSGNRKGELESLLGLAQAYYVIALDAQESDFASKSRELYEAAYTLARELNDKAGMVRALIPTAWFADSWPEYKDQEVANIEEALALSQEIGDEELIIDSKMAVVSSLKRLSRPEAVEQGEELLNLLSARHDLLRLKEVYWNLMWTYLAWGNFERCVECCNAGIRLAAEVGVPPVQYPTLKALALLNLGRYDAAWEALQKEVADEEHHFGSAMKDLGTGIYFLELMTYEKAAEIFESVIEQARSIRRAWLEGWARGQLARSLVQAGRFDQVNLDRITQDLASMGATLPADVMTEIALSEGKLDEALQQAGKACSQAEENGRRPGCVSALELQLRVLLRLDRPRDVLGLADEGIRMAEEMSYLPMTWRTRAAKAQALEMLGDNEAAAQEYEAAAAVIRQLADTIPDAELKQNFMSNPLVSSVIRPPEKEK